MADKKSNSNDKKENEKKNVKKDTNNSKKLTSKERAKYDDMRQIEVYPFDTNND